jgi:carboxymethylenebutenolidase
MSHHASETVQLKAADGHVLDAYLVKPEGKPRGGVVVIQEIFGVTSHIRDVAHQYAAQGFLAIAPAMFDRLQKNVDIPYADVPAGVALMQKAKAESALLDMKAAIDAVSSAGKVGIVGYCWGGRMVYLAACHLAGVTSLAAGVSYYGGGLPSLLDRTPKCPVMFHFGEKDAHIPMSDVDQVKKAYPLGLYYTYPADHGFNCTDRAMYDAASASLAFDRSVEFLHRNVG